MIEAKIDPPARGFAARLARRAAAIARAHAEDRLRRERGDPDRWRLARLLWPHFIED